MIKFRDVVQADLGAIQFMAIGDGVSTTLKLKLNSAPFNLNFQGNIPVSYVATVNGSGVAGDTDVSITVTHEEIGADIYVNISLGVPLLANADPYSIRIVFEYGGL